ncbi:MAG: matrixin family metalloprotease [Dehalococcoidia bacterium]
METPGDPTSTPLGLLARQKPQRAARPAQAVPPVVPALPRRRPRVGLVAGFIIGAVFMGAASFVTVATQGNAWRPLPAHWATTEVGYLADPELAGYVSAGMAQWASASGLRPYAGGGDIQVTFAPLLPPIVHGHQSAQANVSFYGDSISYCEVRVDREKWLELNEFGRQNVLTHELGHCLGLDHSDSPGIMKNPTFYSFSGDDAAGIAALYPRQVVAAPTPEPATPVVTAPAASATAVAVPPVQAASTVAAVRSGPPPAAPTAESRPQTVVTTAPAAAAAPPQAAASQPPSPRPFAGQLDSGWSFVVWTGEETGPANCGCDVVLLFDGSEWLTWHASSPAFLNTLDRVVPGQSYWVFKG